MIDDNIDKWFNKNINGIITLQILNSKDIADVLNIDKSEIKNSKIFPTGNFLEVDGLPVGTHSIRNITKQKIGEISTKNDVNSIYSIEIQGFTIVDALAENKKKLFVNIGNTNANGIVA